MIATPICDKIRAALPDRKGIRMSARSGQEGWIEVRSGHYDARFWDDVEGRQKRVADGSVFVRSKVLVR
jgi:hypothetical protein